MKIVEIREKEIKEISLFLIKRRLIFHPVISVNGQPDFTGYKGREFTLILDRNILTTLIRLLNHGTLKDEISLRTVSTIMAWADFNRISVTSGLALAEYAHHKAGNQEASAENNLFVNAFDRYETRTWFDLALGKRKTIPTMKIAKPKNFNFYHEYDHYKMHYLEMLKICQLYYDEKKTVLSKFEVFNTWAYENILVCKYTIVYLALLLGKKISTFKRDKNDVEYLLKKCKNQAWDLSYLSLWSTLYYYEKPEESIFLFATLDKELKRIMSETHSESYQIFIDLFGNITGQGIIDNMRGTFKKRDLPKIEDVMLDELINKEEKVLRTTIR